MYTVLILILCMEKGQKGQKACAEDWDYGVFGYNLFFIRKRHWIWMQCGNFVSVPLKLAFWRKCVWRWSR
jgi:hypothetical protein